MGRGLCSSLKGHQWDAVPSHLCGKPTVPYEHGVHLGEACELVLFCKLAGVFGIRGHVLDGNGATIIWSDMAWHVGSHLMPEGLVGVLDVGLGVPGDSQVVQSFLCQDGDAIMYMRRVRAVPLMELGSRD